MVEILPTFGTIKQFLKTLLFIKYVRFANKVAISILFCQKCSSYDVCRYPHRLVYITTLRIVRNLKSKSPRNTAVYDIIFHIAFIELNFPDFPRFVERKEPLQRTTHAPFRPCQGKQCSAYKTLN